MQLVEQQIGGPLGDHQYGGVCVGCHLGGIGQGLELTKDWFVEARLQIAANCLGAAIRGFELANEWASQRVQFGVPIRRHQAIEFMLADMAMQVEVARQYMIYAARRRDAGLPSDKEASIAKLFASEMAEKVCSAAIQVHGGYGYVSDFPVERYYRDVRVTKIYEGTSHIQKLIIARQILAE